MELRSIVEALITASDSPLTTEELARIVRARVAEAEDSRARQIEEDESPEELPGWLTALGETSPEQILAAIAELNHSYAETGRAFAIVERARGWRVFTRAEYGDFARLLFPGRKPERLSGPAMETLAIVAYRQPVTKSAIEAVRGVACDGMLQKLLDRELVRIAGRAELPGRPLLYETTEFFFEHFGIRSVDDLPNADELRKVRLPEPDEGEPAAAPEEEQIPLAKAAEPDASGAVESVESAETATPQES